MSDVITLNGKPFIPEDAKTEPALQRPADILREIAKEIDEGKFGIVDMAVIVLMGEEISTFGAGKDTGAMAAVGLMQAAIHKMSRSIIGNK